MTTDAAPPILHHICSRSLSCSDSSCIHRTPHLPNWWCEQPQDCSTFSNTGKTQLVVCVMYYKELDGKRGIPTNLTPSTTPA